MLAFKVSETGVRSPLSERAIFLRTLYRTPTGHLETKASKNNAFTVSGQVSGAVRPCQNVRCPSVGGFLEPHTPDTSDRQGDLRQ